MCGSDIFLQDGSMSLWKVSKLYGVGGKLLSAIKSFYEEASACVKISGETSEHFEIKVGLGQGCHVTMAVQYLYGWCYERNEGQSWGSWSKNIR